MSREGPGGGNIERIKNKGKALNKTERWCWEPWRRRRKRRGGESVRISFWRFNMQGTAVTPDRGMVRLVLGIYRLLRTFYSRRRNWYRFVLNHIRYQNAYSHYIFLVKLHTHTIHGLRLSFGGYAIPQLTGRWSMRPVRTIGIKPITMRSSSEWYPI